MTSYFDKNKRYQIVYPYVSDKIHVEDDLNIGVEKCYREIESRKIKAPLFVIHDIDSNKLYDVEIPKYKNVNNSNNMNDMNIKLNNDQTLSKKAENIDLTKLNGPLNNNHVSNPNDRQMNNDVVMRINKLEYDVMKIKNEIINSNKANNKDKEESCTII